MDPGPVTAVRTVTIRGDVVRLEDLFVNLPPHLRGTEIARAPSPGRATRLDVALMERIARRFGLSWQPGGSYDGVVVRREAAQRILDAEDVAQLLLEAVRKQYRLPGNPSLILDQPQVRLPVGSNPEAEIHYLAYDSRTGRLVARMGNADGDSGNGLLTLSGRVVNLIDVPVAAGAIPAGTRITPALLEIQTVRMDQLPRGTVTSGKQLLGRVVTRAIRAGETFRDDRVESFQAVRRNDLVTMIFQTRQLRLTVEGRALQGGSVGDTIQVMNVRSRQSVLARVLGDRQVLVISPETR